MSILCFFDCYGAHRALHSFPTRRSSDLSLPEQARPGGRVEELRVAHVDRERHVLSLVRAQLFDSSRSEEHTSELQSRFELACRLLLEKKKALRSPSTYCLSHRLQINTSC